MSISFLSLAIWLADKSSVTSEQHTEFYRYIAGAYDSPYYTLHFSSDAPISIHALFYMPERHMVSDCLLVHVMRLYSECGRYVKCR